MALSFRKKEENINSDYRPIFGKRPLFFSAVFFLIGILIAAEWEVYYLFAYALVCIFLLIHVIFRHWRYTGALILAAVFFLGMGCFSFKMTGICAEQPKYNEITVTGRVREISVKPYGGATYKLADVCSGDARFSYNVFVYCDDEDYRLDDVISCTGYLRSPKIKSYEFGFDDRLYCAANGVGLRMTASESSLEYHAEDILSYIDLIRERIGQNMDVMYGNCSPVAKAMLIGIDEDIDAETMSKYRNADISHVLCISGLHVGIICYSVYSVLRRLRAHRLIRYTVSMAVLIAYAALAGFRLSVLRSSIMFAVFLTGDAFSKDYDALTSLSTAFFVLTCINPASVFDVGFQLSFGAVFSIICISGTVFRRKTHPNFVLTAVVTSVAAFLGNMLILSNMNNEINFLSLLVNPFAVALAGITVPIIAITTILYCILGGASVILGYVGIYFISLLNNIAALSDIAGLSAAVPALYGIAVLAGFAVIFICSKYTIAGAKTKIACCCIAALLLPCSLICSLQVKAPVRVDILADRYSNCAVITNSGGDCCLIDAGSGSEDFLRDYGIKPSAVFITALRSKSTGGLECFKNVKIYAPSGCRGDERLDGYEVIYLDGGELIPIGNDAAISVFTDDGRMHAGYNIQYDGRTAFTYLAVSPDAGKDHKTDAVFLNSITQSVPEYILKSSPEYAIIKSEKKEQLEGVTLINTESAGRISIFIGDETEVTGAYES